ncbi:ARID/BRIGHT DNA binding domain [Musa troglodytarum]|uniref:ARID/BRIGHT DNA binding domain n=1 Tax=Musa troglodytarum TaxID=320322 RepID=A0A9E7G080_9LILI|nr:ARID/BRIGHT DNA binding domain [Musa troglodytarum]
MTIVIIVRFAYETVAVLIYSYKVWIFEGTAVSLGLFSILYHSRCCARAPKTFLDQKGVYFSCSGYLTLINPTVDRFCEAQKLVQHNILYFQGEQLENGE